jgi:outer membrane receptor for ferrienterochelin and colicin
MTALGQEDGDLEDEFALLEEQISVDEVESASKHRQSIFWSPSAITVFTREDIRASGATSLSDLLRRVPGFDVYEMKPSFPLVGARALTEPSNNLVLLLVDGREALIELAGFPMWAALTIDLEEIERVEIIRGPGSTLYGANAFSAVVNVTTVSDRAGRSANLFVTGGETGHRRLFGKIRESWELGNGVLSVQAGLGQGVQNSTSDRDDDIMRVNMRSHGVVRYQLGQSLDLSLHAGALLGHGSIYMIVGDFLASNVLNHYEMAKAEMAIGEGMKLSAQFYHIRFSGDFHFRSRFFAYDTWLSDVPDFMMDTHTYDGQFQFDWHAASWIHFIVGANFRYTSLDSDKVIAKGLDQLRGALFIHVEWTPVDVLQLTTGLRIDANSETFGALGPVDLSPRAVLVYRPLEKHSFRLGYALAFRKPSFVESQIHMQLDEYNPAFPEVLDKLRESIGNEELVNEKVHSIEAGWRGRFWENRALVSLDLFYNFYLDMIAFHAEMELDAMGLPNIPDSVYQFQNESQRVDAFGGELEASVSPWESWTFWGNLGLRHVRDEANERLASDPVLRVNGGVRYAPGQGPHFDLAAHFVTSYEVTVLMPDEPFEEGPPGRIDDSLLLIARFGYRFSLRDDFMADAGLTLRTPLGSPFREYPGYPRERNSFSATGADWGGEQLVRLVSFYLRGSF